MVKTSRCWVLILGIVYTMQPGILHPTEQLGSMSPLLSARSVVELQLAGDCAHELLMSLLWITSSVLFNYRI